MGNIDSKGFTKNFSELEAYLKKLSTNCFTLLSKKEIKVQNQIKIVTWNIGLEGDLLIRAQENVAVFDSLVAVLSENLSYTDANDIKFVNQCF